MSCECHTPIDHYCDAWEADNFIIPRNIVLPSDDDRSYFYIKIFAEFSTHNLEEEAENGVYTANYEHVKPFLVPCDQLIHNTTSWPVISNMLSELQIPMEIQPYMLHRISDCAKSVAHAAHNKHCRVLPMIVTIYIEEFVDHINDDDDEEEEDEDEDEDEDVVLMESMDGVAASRQVGASKASVEALETVKVGGWGGFGKKCVICQEELYSLGGEAKRMPCAHVYHGDCIVRWLGASNLCPLCRFEMPT